MSPVPEFEHVERPFLDQLVSMGWKYTTENVGRRFVGTPRFGVGDLGVPPELSGRLRPRGSSPRGERRGESHPSRRRVSTAVGTSPCILVSYLIVLAAARCDKREAIDWAIPVPVLCQNSALLK